MGFLGQWWGNGTLCTSKEEGGPKDLYILVKAYLNNSRLERDDALKVL